MNNSNFPIGYKPLSYDWAPPEWLLPEPLLQLHEGEVQVDENSFSSLAYLFLNEKRPSGFQQTVSTQEHLYTLLNAALKNPLFEHMWKQVLEDGPIELGIDEHMQTEAHYHFSYYNNFTGIHQRKISIKKDTSLKVAFSSLIFEASNAFQTKRFLKLIKIASEGGLDREEYVCLKEYIEFTTMTLAHRILDYGIQHLSWDSDLDEWKIESWIEEGKHKAIHPFALKGWAHVNNIPPSQTLSHACLYRRYWDKQYATKFQQTQAKTHSILTTSTM